MEDVAERGTGSAAPAKETVVRIKRKRTEDPFDSLWLEVTRRAVKRQQPNIAGLSLDGPTTESSGAGAPTKLLFRRVETLSLAGVKELSVSEFQQKVRSAKRSHRKDESKQLKAAQASARVARFEQIWQSRRRRREEVEEEDPMPELFHLYDVVRVDETVEIAAKAERRNQAKREAEARQGQLLCNYLPLLREIVPSVAAEIEALPPVSSEQEANGESSNSFDYVYDVYALDEEMENNATNDSPRPTIQITDADQRDWMGDSEESYDSEDSNDENNPKNDYPEEESADGDSCSDASYTIVDPYGGKEEEYDTVLSDEDREIWRRRR